MTSAPPPAVEEVIVVVPVRDEEERLGACLDAIARAVDALREGPHDAVTVWSVVVLDRCTDDSERIARDRPWVTTVRSQAGRVGAARRLGVQVGLALVAAPSSSVWIATTDGDSRVPADWLLAQLEVAAAGGEVFRGLVEPDVAECGDSAHARWLAAYQRQDDHRHVHGASLGVRADVYQAAGGFAADAGCHEDVGLVARAEAVGAVVVGSARAVVQTSGRLAGRVRDGGFAGYLSAGKSA